MDIQNMLSDKIGIAEIKEIVNWSTGARDRLDHLCTLTHSENRRTSVNALWVITHLPETDSTWIESKRDSMIDMLLIETDVAKKRMWLQILRNQEYTPDNIRTDFLDYCLSKINSECEPYAVRCFSLYAAYRMCRHYPELISELESHLTMLDYQPLSPGLKSALRQTRAKIARLKKSSMPAPTAIGK